MEEEHPPGHEERDRRYCPECGPEAGYMDSLSFLGERPDGYFCTRCGGCYAEGIDGDLRRLAVMLWI